MFFLKDTMTILLNTILLFVVLCYVYPLKFLFSLFLEGNHVFENGKLIEKISSFKQVKLLMIIYGLGFSLVYFVLLLLYINAWSHRNEIQLTTVEQFYKKSELYKQLIMVIIGLTTILTAYIIPIQYTPNIGMLYMLIGPSMFIYFGIRKKMLRKRFSSADLADHDQWLLS